MGGARISPAQRADVVAALRRAGCVFADAEAALLAEAAGSLEDLRASVERRTAGEPLEHVLGWAELDGLRIGLAPGVFVPRRRTALLVRSAVSLARTSRPLDGRPDTAAPVVVDLCCGSGAIGAAVLARVPGADVHAVDVDPVATACAATNLPSGHVYTGDLYAPLPPGLRGRVDLVLANAPYVPTDAIGLLPPEAREREPRSALDGGPDGLTVLSRVVAEAPGWLGARGHLLVESSERQAGAVAAAMRAAGLAPRVHRDDDLGATVVVGTARAGRRSEA